jgi:hypothetical protein
VRGGAPRAAGRAGGQLAHLKRTDLTRDELVRDVDRLERNQGLADHVPPALGALGDRHAVGPEHHGHCTGW